MFIFYMYSSDSNMYSNFCFVLPKKHPSFYSPRSTCQISNHTFYKSNQIVGKYYQDDYRRNTVFTLQIQCVTFRMQRFTLQIQQWESIIKIIVIVINEIYYYIFLLI